MSASAKRDALAEPVAESVEEEDGALAEEAAASAVKSGEA